METRASHVLIGAFTLAGLVLVAALALWAGRYSTLANWADYEIRFSQAVSGLTSGSAVQYSGINVGTVRELSLAPDDPREVIARIRIQMDAPVREDTVARLTPSGLTGTLFIQLSGGSPESPPLRARPGETVPQIPAEESALQRLIGASEGMADTANEVMLRVIELLSEENAQRVTRSLINLESFTDALAADRERISDTLTSVSSASERIDSVLAGADATFRELSSTLEQVNATLVTRLPELGEDAALALRQMNQLTARADAMLEANGDALSRFGAEGLGQLGPTLQELRLLLHDLSRVTRRIDRDPTQYLLGGNQPEEYRPR